MRLTCRRAALAAAAATVMALVALGWPAPASAAKPSCGERVIADWFSDGRVDKVFPFHCYREAIKALPVDIRTYGGAEEDILRALSFARRGKPDPGDKGTTPAGNSTSSPDDQTSTTPGTTPPGGGDGPSAAPDVDTSGPSSVPIPLIVLAVVAGLLLALGAAGYLTRRLATRRADDGDPPTAV